MVLTHSVTWRQSCPDGHTTALNRGGRWCSDGEMVPSPRKKGGEKRSLPHVEALSEGFTHRLGA
jgi:hypothetical protein